MKTNTRIKPADLTEKINHLWELSGKKILSIEKSIPVSKGAPVFTVRGKYTSIGWTEWTQGFQYGSALLQYEATSKKLFLELGRNKTVSAMAPHLTHMGVHDHGFNNVSTYGNLLRMMNDGRIPLDRMEKEFYELALKCSGAVQARRWSSVKGGGGYIYSFNGPHSLFVDTIRSLRSLALAHNLGHRLMEEKDEKVSLLQRLIQHAQATADYNVYYGTGRDSYDVKGRTVHECVFNMNDGSFRCPSSQQGYSPFSTWTRGLAWMMCGCAEELEFFKSLPRDEPALCKGGKSIVRTLMKAARATCDFYIRNTPADGIPYWDTGAPGLSKMGDYLNVPSDPYNAYEPVDSSAAAIAAQGLLRFGRYLHKEKSGSGKKYWQAGLTILDNLFDDPYISEDKKHQGLILHSIYHRPNGWDFIPGGQNIPCGESSMWGDYHAREAALYVQKIINKEKYYQFFG